MPGIDDVLGPRNCRCMEVERSPIRAGDYVRYNGHIVQVTETRLSADGEHILTIEGGAVSPMEAACERTQGIDDWRRGSIIADDPTDDGALPGETTEERVTRQREAAARWMQSITEPGQNTRRVWEAQYTNRPEVGGTRTARQILDEIREEDERAEYGPDGHDFKDERGW